jgi:hypothetical protein
MLESFRGKFIVCLSVRCLLALWALYFPSIYLAYAFLLLSLTWAAMWIGIFKRDYGAEAGAIWWQQLRIYHASSYFVAALSLLLAEKDAVMAKLAYYALVSDVCMGFLAQRQHRGA